jgi:transcriptional regulator with PAS, ATPase and Fis domain
MHKQGGHMTNIADELRSKIDVLQAQLHDQSRLTREYRHAYEDLQEKEAYNFALFQFNPFQIVVVDHQGRVIKSNAAKRKSGDRLPNIGDTMYRDYASKHSIDMHAELMECIRGGHSKTFPEMRYDERYMAITISPFPKGAIIVSQDITEVKRVEIERINLIKDLRSALSEIERLRRLLPICASCKRIRNDNGYWQEIEEYFRRCGNIDFSHTMCPTCVQKIYPDVWERMEQSKQHH